MKLLQKFDTMLFFETQCIYREEEMRRQREAEDLEARIQQQQDAAAAEMHEQRQQQQRQKVVKSDKENKKDTETAQMNKRSSAKTDDNKIQTQKHEDVSSWPYFMSVISLLSCPINHHHHHHHHHHHFI